jgi:hypothetical protein
VDLNTSLGLPLTTGTSRNTKPPANVNYSHRGERIADLLLSRIDAAVEDIRVDSQDIQPLTPDARNTGFAYFQKTGVYPINSLLKADPN